MTNITAKVFKLVEQEDEAACKQIVEKFEAGDFTSTKSIDVISTTTNQHA